MARVTYRGYTYILKVAYKAARPMSRDEILALAGPTAALYNITEENIDSVLRTMTVKDKVFAVSADGQYELTDEGRKWGEVNSR